jgi:hypothetical protein
MVFENRVLRRIFGPKREDVTGDWRTLHNRELNYRYSSINIGLVIKWRIRWAGHIARLGKRESYTRFGWRNPKERDRLGEPGIDERMI